jgi:hypothetical protein
MYLILNGCIIKGVAFSAVKAWLILSSSFHRLLKQKEPAEMVRLFFAFYISIVSNSRMVTRQFRSTFFRLE